MLFVSSRRIKKMCTGTNECEHNRVSLVIHNTVQDTLRFISEFDFQKHDPKTPIFLDDSLRESDDSLRESEEIFIYCLVEGANKAVKYVGQTKEPTARKAGHGCVDKQRKSWYLIVIDVCMSRTQADSFEMNYITCFVQNGSVLLNRIHNQELKHVRSKALLYWRGSTLDVVMKMIVRSLGI